jgi:S1-C subfamily serine protease
MEIQQTYFRRANSISRRDLLKAGLTVGAALSTWPPDRPLVLRGAEAVDTHPIGGNTGWETACERMTNSVHAVISKRIVKGNPLWITSGTAFLISLDPYPILVTNAHLVADKNRNLRPEIALGVFSYPSAAAAGLRVRVFAPELDLAILRASPEAAIGKVVTFSDRAPLPRGAPVASLGFPIPAAPRLRESGGSLSINLRLATGFISSSDHTGLSFDDAPWTPNDLPYYELNMLSYPGISGGPLFNLDGTIVGVSRGSRTYNQQIAAYAYALRNREVLQLLEDNGLTYQKA